MSIKNDHELPSLTPDRDQVERFKSSHSIADAKAKVKAGSKDSIEPQNIKLQRSEWRVFTTLLIFSLGSFGGWWFYQQDLQTQAIVEASERRILELEKQLSVTGEELGESAGDMKARLTVLTKKTEELWTEMDKLWASAWRRNQAEIADLAKESKTTAANLSKQTAIAADSLKAMNQKLTDNDFTIGILTEQVQAAQKLKSQLDEIKNSFASLQTKSLTKDKQQIDLAISLTQLKNEQQLLIERIKRLESRLAITVP